MAIRTFLSRLKITTSGFKMTYLSEIIHNSAAKLPQSKIGEIPSEKMIIVLA